MSVFRQRKLDFSDVSLYGISASVKDERSLLDRVKKLLFSGLDALQLRTRELTDREFFQLALKLNDMCRRTGALFIVDNRPDVALAAGADGVHLGHEDLPLKEARDILGHRKIIGASTHSLPQALEAERNGADYVSCGPLWATPTKPEYQPVGLDLIGLYRTAVRIPFVAIGGINESNVEAVVKAGARSIAVVRALFESDHPAETVKFFKEKVEAGSASLAR